MSVYVRGSNKGIEYKRDDQSFFKGIVIKNDDREQLLRVKVYLPEVSNQPLENWLQSFSGSSINVRFPGVNNPSDNWSDTKIFEEMSKFIPWAEPVVPILGEHGPMRYNAPNEIAVGSDANFKEGFQTNDEKSPNIEEGSFAPAFPYQNQETNIGDAFTDPTNNYTVNNNPYGQDFQPNNYSNAPAGVFGVPRVGAQVWVFHYRGDLNFPVYFGGRVSYRETGPIFADAVIHGDGPAPSQDYPGIYENKPATSGGGSGGSGSGSGGAGASAGGTSDQPRGARIVPGQGVPGSNLTEFVEEFEGYNPEAYDDFGQTSIGYGTKARPGETTISRQEADRRLNEELSQSRQEVMRVNNQQDRNWNENQIDALTSFTYNTGGGNLRRLTQSDRSDQQIADTMLQYENAGGRPLAGLTRRRRAERELFMTGYN